MHFNKIFGLLLVATLLQAASGRKFPYKFYITYICTYERTFVVFSVKLIASKRY